MRTLIRVWLVSLGLSLAAGCGRDPAPPKVDAAAEAEDEQLIKDAGERERKARKAQAKNPADAD